MVWRLIDGAAEFGGVLTINWHDRSIAPERLWDGFYLKLLRELKSRGAWFATAAQTVSWFRKRRSAVVEASACGKRKDQNQGFGQIGPQVCPDSEFECTNPKRGKARRERLPNRHQLSWTWPSKNKLILKYSFDLLRPRSLIGRIRPLRS